MLNSRVQTSNDTKLVSLEGRIDMSNAEKFEDLILTDMDLLQKIELDLSDLTFIDSTGVGYLVSVIKKCKQKNISFKMSNVPEGVEQILEIIGVYDVLKLLYGNEEV